VNHSGCDRKIFNDAGWQRNGHTIFAQPLDKKFDSPANFVLGFLDCLSGSNATGQMK
jgi:hypothetical protein